MPDIKKWNGSAWVDAENKRWDGSNWVDAYTYKWDGSNWIQIYPAFFSNKTVKLNFATNYKLNITTGELEYQQYYDKYNTTVDKIAVKPNTSYFVDFVDHYMTICEYGENGNYLNIYKDVATNKQFTVSANTHFIRIFLRADLAANPGLFATLTGMLK